jgi:glycogen debranching enzyme
VSTSDAGGTNTGAGKLRVLLVSPAAHGGQPGRWLRRTCELDAHVAGWNDATDDASYDVVWIDVPALELAPAPPRALADHPDTAVLLTRGACGLLASLGFDTTLERTDTVWRDADDEFHLFDSFTEFPHIRGHVALRRHALFNGLGNGAYTWWPADGEAFARLALHWPDWPADAEVIAVERSYIHLNPDRATIWRHQRSNGANVLCIGAYLPFESSDLTFRAHLERLTRNALYAAARRDVHADGNADADVGAGRGARAGLVWHHRTPATIDDATLRVAGARSADARLPAFDGPSLDGTPAADSPFTLAGRRVLIAGGEARGVDEVWVHPLRVLSELRVADAETLDVRITPTGVERTLRVGTTTVTERIFAAYDDAVAAIEWSADGPVALALSFRSDLRLMWPYPGWSLSPLRWRRDGDVLTVRGSAGDDTVGYAWSRTPDRWDVSDASTETNAVVAARVVVSITGRDDAVRLTIGARVDGDAADVHASPSNVAAEEHASPFGATPVSALVDQRNDAIRRLLDDRLAVTCAEPLAGAALQWGSYRLDSAIVRTPSVGTGLVAGYWRAGSGWGDGRPGYGWYFGRDAVWTALGSLAVGDFDAAALTLRFLGRHQDLTGKILHECTTSGVVHYDAADSTTLYLLLAARYLAWTGDRALLLEEWPRIRRAFDFALTTDHDADGLIENTCVGHGWIEFGRLGGGDVTHYNAAIWTAALAELADAARVAGEADFATRLVALAIRARRALERTFHDEREHRYALNVRRNEDGAWRGTWTQTALHAVPLLLGMAEPARMQRWLDDVAGDAFTAPWGVRMVPDTDEHYDPASYHGGAVWPLYTGWVSWAEFAAGRTRSAVRHWRMNAELGFADAKGAWTEVMHGAEPKSAGVCPDQAWSTAMAVAPFVCGLLGVEPDALRRRARLAPQIPDEWDTLRVERLRIGDAHISLDYTRDGDVHRYRLAASEPGFVVAFEPALSRQVTGVLVDGQPVAAQVEPFGERQRVRLQLALGDTVTVEVQT